MTTVYLIRHAEAEGNLYRRCQGWYNSLITEKGYRQIAALERRFEGVPIDAVYSSDLFRTMTTAGAVYKRRGLTLNTVPELREVHGGVWEDKTWGELWRTEPETLQRFYACDPTWSVPQSDTFAGLQERVCGAILRLAAAHDGQTIALFCHGTAIRTAVAKFSGLPLTEIAHIPHGDNTCVSCLTVEDGAVKLEYYNDDRHLGALATQTGRSAQQEQSWDAFGRCNLWFRPLDLEREAGTYRTMHREAWQTIHGTLRGLNEDGFLREATLRSADDPHSTTAVMQEERLVGLLELDLWRDAEQGVGDIAFYYLDAETRHQGLGVQLLGEAVSRYRALGRERLRLRCAPSNETAQRFYRRYGFVKVGEEPGAFAPLAVLEKYIGYEDRYE